LAEVGVLFWRPSRPSGDAGGKAAHRDRHLKLEAGVLGLGETLVGLASRIAAKICAYTTYAFFLVNRRLDRPQGRIKELWA
jgi:hypothetical protein